MTQPDSHQTRATSKRTLINGSCLVLTVIGLALVSNRLLDMADLANEQGLSVEERKEKARRNDADYRQTSSGSTLNPFTWFAKQTADKMCADRKIAATVAGLIKANTVDLANLAQAAGKLDAGRVGGAAAAKELDAVRLPENQVRITSEGLPARFDRDLNLAICQVSYTIKGLGFSEHTPLTATYTVQEGKQDWVVTLNSLN